MRVVWVFPPANTLHAEAEVVPSISSVSSLGTCSLTISPQPPHSSCLTSMSPCGTTEQ